MSEVCSIRSINQKDKDNFINEQNTPQACIECLRKALSTRKFRRKITDTSASAAREMKEFYNDDQDPTDEEQWQSTLFSYEGHTADRIARIETGYELGGQPYFEASVHTIEEITFQCEIESKT